MILPTAPRSAVRPLLAFALLASVACGGHRGAGGAPSQGGGGGSTTQGDAAPRVVERCDAAPAAGSRCAEAVAALGGLATGAKLQGGRVTEVAIDRDRLVLSLTADDGQILGVEAARPDGAPRAPPPLAKTATLSLYIRSDAPGAMTPGWQLALAQALADALARSPGPVPAWLAPLRDPGNPGGH